MISHNNDVLTEWHVNNSSYKWDRVAFLDHKHTDVFCPAQVIQTLHSGLETVAKLGH